MSTIAKKKGPGKRPDYKWSPTVSKVTQKAFEHDTAELNKIVPLVTKLNDIIDTGWLISMVINHPHEKTKFTIIATKVI